MLWLRRPPWAKWIATGLVVVIAFWIELRPDPSVMHPFATSDILPGETITELNTDLRSLPAGSLQPIQANSIASRHIFAGEPVLVSDTSDDGLLIPEGWWIISTDLPRIAEIGDAVQLLLLDTGAVIAGVVAIAVSDDPFGTESGAVAVDPAHAAQVARSAAEGRVAVLVEAG